MNANNSVIAYFRRTQNALEELRFRIFSEEVSDKNKEKAEIHESALYLLENAQSELEKARIAYTVYNKMQ